MLKSWKKKIRRTMLNFDELNPGVDDWYRNRMLDALLNAVSDWLNGWGSRTVKENTAGIEAQKLVAEALRNEFVK